MVFLSYRRLYQFLRNHLPPHRLTKSLLMVKLLDFLASKRHLHRHFSVLLTNPQINQFSVDSTPLNLLRKSPLLHNQLYSAIARLYGNQPQVESSVDRKSVHQHFSLNQQPKAKKLRNNSSRIREVLLVASLCQKPMSKKSHHLPQKRKNRKL